MKNKKIIKGAAVMAVIIAVLIMLYFEFTPAYLVLTNGDTGELLAEFPVLYGDNFYI